LTSEVLILDQSQTGCVSQFCQSWVTKLSCQPNSADVSLHHTS